MTRPVLALILVPFTALSVAAVWNHGYWGIFAQHFENLAGAQVIVDLAIALILLLAVMRKDARELGRPFTPWLVCTLALGSFGPLLYLWTRKPGERER